MSDDELRKKLDRLLLEYTSSPDPLVRRLKALLHEREVADMLVRSMLDEEHVVHIPPQPPEEFGLLQITSAPTVIKFEQFEPRPPPRSRHERRADAALQRRQR